MLIARALPPSRGPSTLQTSKAPIFDRYFLSTLSAQALLWEYASHSNRLLEAG
jgi:hypothetical protein